jgi:DNA polymerase III delta subunit
MRNVRRSRPGGAPAGQGDKLCRMQVALAQLSSHLQKGLSPLYVLHGDEPLLQQEAADAIRATARAQGYTERSSYTVAGELTQAQVEAAVLNVARYDVFKLSESVLSGHTARVQRMLDGLQAEGEAEVLVHWALAEDIRALKRVKDAMNAGRPLPMALRENRIWGPKERLFERILPTASDAALARLLQSAHIVDGIVKGLKQPDWPQDGWQALQRLALQVCRLTQAAR